MKNDNVIITLACNDKYTEYAMVLIFSIYSNRNPNRTYEIKLFANGLTNTNKKRIASLTSLNFDVMVYDITKELQLSSDSLLPHISVDTYTRFFIVNHLRQYNKIIYLDIDMIVCNDLSKLFDLDLDNHTLGVVKDLKMSEKYNDIHEESEYIYGTISIHHYMKYILKLKHPSNYFQAGMLLIDINNINKKLPLNKALNLIDKQFILADQDILNYVFNDDVIMIDGSWNIITKYTNKKLKNHNILHYAGYKKPWNTNKLHLGNIWWNYAYELHTITPLEIVSNFKQSKNLNGKEKRNQINAPTTLNRRNSFYRIKQYINAKSPRTYNILKVPYRMIRSLYRIVFNKGQLGRTNIIKNELKINSKSIYFLAKNMRILTRNVINISPVIHNHTNQINHTSDIQNSLLRELTYNNAFILRHNKTVSMENIITAYHNIALSNHLKDPMNINVFRLLKNINVINENSKTLCLCDAFFVWGNMLVSDEMLNAHMINHNPIIFCEDGFLRSKNTAASRNAPAKDKLSYAFTFDDLGYHFDVNRPNRLIQKLFSNEHLSETQIQRSQINIERIVDNRISKYNHQPPIDKLIGTRNHKVVIIDQSPMDYSLLKGNLSYNSIFDMVLIALEENPNSDIIVKIHPDNISLKNNSKLRQTLQKKLEQHIEYNKRLFIYYEPANPISFLQKIDKVYVFSSQMGFEALMMKKEVVTFGTPFYAGWGLTEDRNSSILDTRYNNGQVKVHRSIEELFYFSYIWYSHYVSPYTQQACEIEEVINYFIEENNNLNTLTICIPVYNSYNYLHKAISSILIQNNVNIEILIIDDNSTDNSRDIIEYYKQKDNRIKSVYLSERQGLHYTRIEALKHTKTKYITFLNPMDFLTAQKLDSVLINLQRHEPDLLSLNANYSSIDGTAIETPSNIHKYNMDTYFDYSKDFLTSQAKSNIVTNVYSMQLFNDNLMNILSSINNIYYAEDLLFSILIVDKIEIAYYISDTVYNFNQKRTPLNDKCDFTNIIPHCADLHTIIQYIFSLINRNYFMEKHISQILNQCLTTLIRMFNEYINTIDNKVQKDILINAFYDIFKDDLEIFKQNNSIKGKYKDLVRLLKSHKA